ncbi:hypothetical protein ACA910_013369 [Epithemia clementina (nom. ined.)]
MTNPIDFSAFVSWLMDPSYEELSEERNADAASQRFHSDPPILLTNEKVETPFRRGRDLYLYTTHRVLIVDVQGIQGKRVDWCKTFEQLRLQDMCMDINQGGTCKAKHFSQDA